MKAISKVNIGSVVYEFECDGKDGKEAISQAITLANPPRYCNVCKNHDPAKFKLDTNQDKDGNIYIKIRCIANRCGATCGLGEYKNGSGYFWRKPFEVYQPKGATPSTATPSTDQMPQPDEKYDGSGDVNPEDIPF